jgi:hypothetical protein
MTYTLKDWQSKSEFMERIKIQTKKLLKIDSLSPSYKNFSKMIDSLSVQLIELFMYNLFPQSPNNSNFNIGMLSYCHPNNFSSKVNMTPDEIKRHNMRGNLCGNSFSLLLGNMQPYMFIGYAVGFVKPICNFPSLKKIL